MRRADARDETMIQRPLEWPSHPLLPVKRAAKQDAPGGWPELGFLCDIPKYRLTVFEHNMFSLGELPGDTYGEKLAAVEVKHVYATLDALLDDGWYVD